MGETELDPMSLAIGAAAVSEVAQEKAKQTDEPTEVAAAATEAARDFVGSIDAIRARNALLNPVYFGPVRFREGKVWISDPDSDHMSSVRKLFEEPPGQERGSDRSDEEPLDPGGAAPK